MIRKKNRVIKYKWDNGTYNLKNMIELVLNNTINEEQFFSITRYNYKSIKEKYDSNQLDNLKNEKNYDII